MICNKKHRFDKDFDLLPEAQDDRKPPYLRGLRI